MLAQWENSWLKSLGFGFDYRTIGQVNTSIWNAKSNGGQGDFIRNQLNTMQRKSNKVQCCWMVTANKFHNMWDTPEPLLSFHTFDAEVANYPKITFTGPQYVYYLLTR